MCYINPRVAQGYELSLLMIFMMVFKPISEYMYIMYSCTVGNGYMGTVPSGGAFEVSTTTVIWEMFIVKIFYGAGEP